MNEIKNLPVQICARDKTHKFIKTHKGQTKCYFCEHNLPYPPPKTVSWREKDDYDNY
jgi:hypothetical protein